MAEKKRVLTEKGLKDLEDELQELRVVKRKEIAQSIKEAREQGDLSENAEYKAAKEEQNSIEKRIEYLEETLKNVEVIYSDSIDIDKVGVGCVVTVERKGKNKPETLRIVGSTEIDILGGAISNESPIGAALMGAKVGDVVSVDTAKGTTKFKVLEIGLAK